MSPVIDSRITMKAAVWFLTSKFSFCWRIVYNFRDSWRGNDNIGWNDLQMPFKVIGDRTYYQSKSHVWVAILVYSNFHRFRDTSCFNAENHMFAYPTCMTLNLKVMPLECGDEIWIMGLPCGEEIMIMGRTMWVQSTSQTDGQTDLHRVRKKESGVFQT